MAHFALFATCLVIILATQGVKGQATSCPEGFETHNQDCYKIIFNNATWVHAHEFCRAMGARMLSIESHEEQTYIAGLMISLNVNSFAKPNRYWMGGTDLSEYRTFRWTYSSAQLTYTHWRQFEPFGRDGIERCMEMYHDHGWNDYDCEKHQNFICEKSLT